MCAQLCTSAPGTFSHTVTHTPLGGGPQGPETLRAPSSPSSPSVTLSVVLTSQEEHMHVETQSILLPPLCPQEKKPASISLGPTLPRGLASLFLLRLKEKEERGILSVSPGGKQGPAIESLPTAEVVRMQSQPRLAAQILGSVQRPELEGWGTK